MTESTGKYSGIIKGAKQTGKPESQKAAPDPEVNLCARVPKSHRQWWSGQAKLKGTTMTEIIKAALTAEFGLPPE